VKVRHGEGVANRTGPKPCVCVREDAGEASAGEFTGQPRSRVRIESGRRRRCEGGRQHDGMRRSQVSQRPGTTKLYDRRGYNPEKSASFFATY